MSKDALIFYTGTFAPFHHGHLELVESAKTYLESNGWNVVRGHIAPVTHLRPGRLGEFDQLLGGVKIRSEIIDIAISLLGWLKQDPAVDDLLNASDLRNNRHAVQTMFNEYDRPMTTFWVNGIDGYIEPTFLNQLSEAANANPNNPLRMLVIKNREVTNNWSVENIADKVPKLEPMIDRCTVVNSKPTSATEIRNALIQDDREMLPEKVGIPAVETYLLKLLA